MWYEVVLYKVYLSIVLPKYKANQIMWYDVVLYKVYLSIVLPKSNYVV